MNLPTTFFDIMDDFFSDTHGSQRDKFPKIECCRTSEKLYINAIVAGYEKEDIKANILNGVLTIEYEPLKRSIEPGVEMEMTIFSEIKRSSFSRKIRLPVHMLDMNNIESGIEDGILRIVIPLLEKDKSKGQQLKIHY